jgi:hypothetical protein
MHRLSVCLATAAVLLAGCGSGAFTAPGSVDAADAPDTTTAAAPEADPGEAPAAGPETAADPDVRAQPEDGADAEDDLGPDFSVFSLPQGPRTPADTREDDVYLPLQSGDCDGARTALEDFWADLRSPRSVFLYEAGVSLCQGDEGGADAWFGEAAAYGWAGMDTEFFVVDDQGQTTGTFRYDCELFRSLVGVLQRIDRDTVQCAAGAAPPWPDESYPRDDPRTPEDDRLAPQDDEGPVPGDGEVTKAPEGTGAPDVTEDAEATEDLEPTHGTDVTETTAPPAQG